MESSEHVWVGDSIQLTAPDGTKKPAATWLLDLMSGPLAYGYIVALGGDLYGTTDLTPISSSGDQVGAFNDAFSTLDNADIDQRKQIIEVIDEEIAKVADVIQDKKPPSTAFDELGDSLSGRWNSITNSGLPIPDDETAQLVALVTGPYGRYMNLAVANMDHFGADAWSAYVAGHTAALERAKGLHGRDPAAHPTVSQLRKAYAMNAFADHFLTDLFAGGHARTPRRALNDRPDTATSESGYLAKAMHDEDNKNAVLFQSRGDESDTWLAYGDGYVRNTENQTNLTKAIAAVQRSADDVYDAFAKGSYDKTHAAMQELVPIVGDSNGQKPPVAGPSIHTAPLFYVDNAGKVHRRKNLADTSDYEYSADADWSDLEMVGEILSSAYLGIGKASPPVPN